MNYGKKGTLDRQKALNSKAGKLGRKANVLAFKAVIVGAIVLALVLLFTGVGVFKGVIDSAPEITDADVSPTGFSTTVYDKDGNVITQLVGAGANRVYVTIDEIPVDLQNAFIAIEDERFYEHNGIDIKGIFRAAYVGIKSVLGGGQMTEGASTITQQLLKNTVFDGGSEDNFADKLKRKIQEQYLAIEIEELLPKESILEKYLNTINLGQNTLGVQSASARYFGKDVSELTISECAVIAAITNNPTRYNPITYPENNAERRAKILKNMLDNTYITQEQYDEALADDVYSRISEHDTALSEDSSVTSYFVDALTTQVVEDLINIKGYSESQAYSAIYTSGLSIYTTQDSAIQQICDEEIENLDNYPGSTQVSVSTWRLTVTKADGTTVNYSENQLKAYFREQRPSSIVNVFSSEEDAYAFIEQFKSTFLVEGDQVVERTILSPEPQVSFVVMDQTTGYVAALVGGRGNKTASQSLNRATYTTRQPGSTFKVLSTFAPALDSGKYTLASVENDAPYTYSGTNTTVNNWWSSGVYYGYSTARRAITKSMNIVTVKFLRDITPSFGIEYLQKFGITTLTNDDYYETLALGGISLGVTNLELTAAYATIANSGTYTEPVLYTKILDHDGNVLIDNTVPYTSQVLKETTAYLLTDAMRDVVSSSDGTAGPANFSGMDIAGKSGTTSDDNDLWFVGYTPYYTAGIWTGYDDNGSLASFGGSYHERIWSKIMSRIHANLEYDSFDQPAGIVTAEVCSKCGNLATPDVCNNCGNSTINTEIFAEGTQPTEYCTCHTVVRVCADSGQAASDSCTNVTEVVYFTPAEISQETEDSPYLLPEGFLEKICELHTGSTTTPATNSEEPTSAAETHSHASTTEATTALPTTEEATTVSEAPSEEKTEASESSTE